MPDAPVSPQVTPGSDDDRVQVNVRLPKALRDEIDARRAPLRMSRDEWMRRALTFAMQVPTRNRSSAVVTAIGRRTVPRRRPTP